MTTETRAKKNELDEPSLMKDFEAYLNRVAPMPFAAPQWFKGLPHEWEELRSLALQHLRPIWAMNFLNALQSGERPWELASGRLDSDATARNLATGAPVRQRPPSVSGEVSRKAQELLMRRDLLDAATEVLLEELAHGQGNANTAPTLLGAAESQINLAFGSQAAARAQTAALATVRITNAQRWRPGGATYQQGAELKVTAEQLAQWRDLQERLNAQRARQFQEPLVYFTVLQEPKQPASSLRRRGPVSDATPEAMQS